MYSLPSICCTLNAYIICQQFSKSHIKILVSHTCILFVDFSYVMLLCMCTCVCMCVHVCMCVCMHVCMCVEISTHLPELMVQYMLA